MDLLDKLDILDKPDTGRQPGPFASRASRMASLSRGAGRARLVGNHQANQSNNAPCFASPPQRFPSSRTSLCPFVKYTPLSFTFSPVHLSHARA